MPKKEFQPSVEQKKVYLDEHYAYEVKEVLYCIWFSVSARQHKVGAQQSLESFLENTSLDHCLPHARNLLEFYYRGSKPHMYANAWAFVPDWRPGKMSANLESLDKRVYSEVTHLGWDRLLVKKKGWILADVTNDLLAMTEKFLHSLSPVFRSPTLDALTQEVRQYRTYLDQNQPFADMFESLEQAGHRWQ